MKGNSSQREETKERGKLAGGCSLMTLTSKSNKPYWFRTCDISFDLRKEGAGRVVIEKGEVLSLEGEKQMESRYHIQGISYRQNKTWLLDGINEEGLCGGLLMLSEGIGKERTEGSESEVMAMEAVTCFLAKCKDAGEVMAMAEKVEITNIIYKEEVLPATVHYHFLDIKGEEVILEPVNKQHPGKLNIYQGKETLGVMTNSPAYQLQKENLSWFLAGSPELKNNKWQEKLCLTLDGKKIWENKHAYHISPNYSFPGSYSSYDRFIRLAVLKSLNESGNRWSDKELLPYGVSIMNAVREPESQGILHYSCLRKAEEGVEQSTSCFIKDRPERMEVTGSEKSKTVYEPK